MRSQRKASKSRSASKGRIPKSMSGCQSQLHKVEATANTASCSTKGVLGTLLKTSFNNFSKAEANEDHLTNHDIYSYHRDAMVMGKAFLSTYASPEVRIYTILERKGQAICDKNRHILSAVADT